MSLRHVRSTTEYLRLLRGDEKEVKALRKDRLITETYSLVPVLPNHLRWFSGRAPVPGSRPPATPIRLGSSRQGTTPRRSRVVSRSSGGRGSEAPSSIDARSEEHTSEIQSRLHLVCRL